LQYPRSTTLDCKDIEITKSELVTKTQYPCKKAWFLAKTLWLACVSTSKNSNRHFYMKPLSVVSKPFYLTFIRAFTTLNWFNSGETLPSQILPELLDILFSEILEVCLVQYPISSGRTEYGFLYSGFQNLSRKYNRWQAFFSLGCVK